MRIFFTTIKIFVSLLCAIHVAESRSETMKTNNFWDYSQNFFAQLLRQGRNSAAAAAAEHTSSSFSPSSTSSTTSTITLNSTNKSTIQTSTFTPSTFTTTTTTIISPTLSKLTNKTQQQTVPIQLATTTIKPISQTESSTSSSSQSSTTIISSSTSSSTIISASTTTTTDSTTANTIIIADTTTPEYIATTGEPRESPNGHEFVLPSSSSVKRGEKPQIKISSNISQNLLPLPPDANAALIKPTKYHYYPHNQHIYFLPECAIQQVCNAVYVRLNWTQPLCACSSRSSACSASLNSDDLHTTELSINKKYRKAVTLVKTCEPTSEMRICRATRDWSLLALQNIRTGKSHYLVICRCPESSTLEGPMSHDTPTYASVPGIRVYGMMCVDNNNNNNNNKRRGRPLRATKNLEIPSFPWKKAKELAETAIWD